MNCLNLKLNPVIYWPCKWYCGSIVCMEKDEKDENREFIMFITSCDAATFYYSQFPNRHHEGNYTVCKRSDFRERGYEYGVITEEHKDPPIKLEYHPVVYADAYVITEESDEKFIMIGFDEILMSYRPLGKVYFFVNDHFCNRYTRSDFRERKYDRNISDDDDKSLEFEMEDINNKKHESDYEGLY